MLKFKKLINISKDQIQVHLGNGQKVFLPAKGILEDVQVLNFHELAGKVIIRNDLTEVRTGNEETRISEVKTPVKPKLVEVKKPENKFAAKPKTVNVIKREYLKN